MRLLPPREGWIVHDIREDVHAGLSSVPAQEQPTPCITVVTHKSLRFLAQRYAYLPPHERVGRLVQVARTAKRLKLAKLATATGIDKKHLLAIEQGVRTIKHEEATHLAGALGIEVSLLLAAKNVSVPVD